MNSSNLVSISILISLLAVLWPPARLRADDIAADNITIQQAALFGMVYTDTSATTLAEGLRIDASQDTAEVYHTSTTPGYFDDNWVTIEEFGEVEIGHWEYTTEYQIVGYDKIPATYDEDGNIITPESYEPRWDDVVTGSTWVSEGTTWGVTGTHQENQPVWRDEQTNSWTETTAGGTPRVRFNATRSDTNFTFRVPSPGTPDGMKDILVVWEGGLTLPNIDTSRTSVFTSGSLQQSWWRSVSNTYLVSTSNVRAESITQRSTASYSAAGAAHLDTSENEARPEYLRLTRTENVNGTSTVAQTQIAAKSATFAGVVEVSGNLKVQGALLVQPQGDLLMGAYTNGPQP